MRRVWRKMLFVVAAVATGGLLATNTAIAGNIYLTGHDLDFHCNFGSQCNAFGAALNFARVGAPAPSKPVLFVDSGTEVQGAAGQTASKARNTVEGAGNAFPFVVVAPQTAAWTTATLNTGTFSAIVFASGTNCGGCDLTQADINAINTRTADIQAFFNQGGGLVYLSGAQMPNYYASVPVPASAVAVSPPFTVTAVGAASPFNLTTSDANCCATHNSFNLPGGGSPLLVLELDSAGFAETLAAGNVTIGGGGLVGGGAACPAHAHGHTSTGSPDHFGNLSNPHAHHAQHGTHLVPNTCPPHAFGHRPLTPEPEEPLAGVSAAASPPDFVAALNQDGAAEPAARGTVLQLFGSAEGLYLDEQDTQSATEFTPPASGSPLYYTTSLPEVLLDAAQTKVLFSGLAPGLRGVWQINVLVPEQLRAGKLPVVVFYEGQLLRSVDVEVQ